MSYREFGGGSPYITLPSWPLDSQVLGKGEATVLPALQPVRVFTDNAVLISAHYVPGAFLRALGALAALQGPCLSYPGSHLPKAQGGATRLPPPPTPNSDHTASSARSWFLEMWSQSRLPRVSTAFRECPGLAQRWAAKEKSPAVGWIPRQPGVLRRAGSCWAVEAAGAAAWVYLERLLAVPGPRALGLGPRPQPAERKARAASSRVG